MGKDESVDGAVQRLDAATAHNARVWNYWQGGKDNYKVDQQVGDHVAGMIPVIRDIARTDREFLGRAVRCLAEESTASASSSTSAPACRPWRTPTRSPSGSLPSRGSCTSTTTPSCSRTPAPC